MSEPIAAERLAEIRSRVPYRGLLGVVDYGSRDASDLLAEVDRLGAVCRAQRQLLDSIRDQVLGARDADAAAMRAALERMGNDLGITWAYAGTSEVPDLPGGER